LGRFALGRLIVRRIRSLVVFLDWEMGWIGDLELDRRLVFSFAGC